MAEFEQVFEEDNRFLYSENEEHWDNWVLEFMETPAFDELSDYEQENMSDLGWILFREMEEQEINVVPFEWTERKVVEVVEKTIKTVLWETEEEFNGFKTTTLALMRFLVEEKQHLNKDADFLTQLTGLICSETTEYDEVRSFQLFSKELMKEAGKLGIDLAKNPERMDEIAERVNHNLEILERYAQFLEEYDGDEDKALAALENDEERKVVLDEIMETMIIPEDEFSERIMQQVLSKMQRLLKKYRGNQDKAFDELPLEEQRYMVTYMMQQQQEEERQMPVVRSEPKIGRNDPCPCGSGKKYKKCHGA